MNSIPDPTNFPFEDPFFSIRRIFPNSAVNSFFPSKGYPLPLVVPPCPNIVFLIADLMQPLLVWSPFYNTRWHSCNPFFGTQPPLSLGKVLIEGPSPPDSLSFPSFSPGDLDENCFLARGYVSLNFATHTFVTDEDNPSLVFFSPNLASPPFSFFQLDESYAFLKRADDFFGKSFFFFFLQKSALPPLSQPFPPLAICASPRS